MKLFKKLRKGFTLIELVVVIAVIAILAAVSVVSYVAITNKAKQSNDQQKIDQVNLSVAAAEISKKPATMHEALESVEQDGFLVENFKAEAKNYEFGYSLSENRFLILDGDKVVYPKEMTKLTKSPDIWKFSSSKDNLNKGYSYYLLSDVSGEVEVTNGGLDVGKNNDITKVSFHSTQGDEYVVRTFGGEVKIGKSASDVAKGQIHLYGLADKNEVYVESTCLHNHGAVGKMQLKAGKSIAEKGGIVYLVEAKNDGVAIEENGGRFVIPEDTKLSEISDSVATEAGYAKPSSPSSADATFEEATQTKSNSYDIGTLAELETFRDLVNGGFAFSGCKIKLTANIALNDGWRPIGEGARQVGATKYYGNYAGENAEAKAFFGEFDGNGKTISNLNNNGFVPRFTTLDDGAQTYAYGFFGIVSGDAYIHDLTLKNVNIDASVSVKNINDQDSMGDSVGALVGFIGHNGNADGNLVRIENVKVQGTIKAHESAGGLVGRAYPTGKWKVDGKEESMPGKTSFTIKDCTNEAAVICHGKAAGILGTISNFSDTTGELIKDCVNSGAVTSEATYGTSSSGYHRAAGIAVCSTGTTWNRVEGCSNTGKLMVGSDEKVSQLVVYTGTVQTNK